MIRIFTNTGSSVYSLFVYSSYKQLANIHSCDGKTNFAVAYRFHAGGSNLSLGLHILAWRPPRERGHPSCGATDHVIESFRNQLWSGYKDGQGIEAELHAQFSLLEETLTAAGVVVWPMIEYEADDALAAAAKAVCDERVERVLICTPDKDLAQCVRGQRVVQMNRRTRSIRDELGVVRDFGVLPASIPDYLALVGDASDGYPGLPGWGAKSTAVVLRSSGILNRFHRTGVSGALRLRVLLHLHVRFPASAMMHSCFG